MKDLVSDILIIIVTAVLAIAFINTSFFSTLLSFSALHLILVFLAGMFFTSAFTIAPAAIVLSQLSHFLPAHWVIILGGAGAVLGDYIIFYFIRDRFSVHLMKALKKTRWKVFFKSFHLGFLKYLMPIVGAMIIASPLPDELGIMLMGISKMKTRLFILVAFLMNMIGVAGVVLLSKLF